MAGQWVQGGYPATHCGPIACRDLGDDNLAAPEIVLGTYRLLLAYAVAISHMNFDLRAQVGVLAVISFLLLSGYVMTALIQKYYMSIEAVPAFYADRFVRLAPQFYFYITLALILFLVFGLGVPPWLVRTPTWQETALQYIVVPLNFYLSFIGNALIPQAWSLGLEVMFYALFPFILIWRLRLPAAMLSFVVYVAAYFRLIDPDLFGYRYLPGVLFIFICGSWIYQAETPLSKKMPLAFWIAALALLCGLHFAPELKPYTRDFVLGLIIGIPAVWLLAHYKIVWIGDEMAGNLSYGVFLNHLIAYAIVVTLLERNTILCAASTCILSTAMSYVTFTLLEKPLIERRRGYRKVSIVSPL